MKAFTIYDPTTGEIRRAGVVSDDSDASSQAAAGEAVLLDVRGDYTAQKVDITQTPPVLAAK